MQAEPKPNLREVGRSPPPVAEQSSSHGEPIVPPPRSATGVLAWICSLYLWAMRQLTVSRPQKTPIPSTRRSSILIRLHLREIITTILSLVPASATVLLTYSGMSDGLAEGGATIKSKTEAAIFSFGIGALCFLVNLHFFGLIDRLRGRYLALSILGGVTLLAAIAAIDAPFNMRGLAGGTAVRMSIEDTGTFYETETRLVFARIGATQQLLPSIRANAKLYRDQQQHEFKTGAMSRSPGPGKVESSFGRVATLLEQLADALERDQGKAAALQESVSTLIRELKKQVYVQGGLRDRIEAAASAADRIDVLLGQLGQQDATISLRATLKGLEGLFPAAPPARTAFERRQNEAIAQIAAMTAPIVAGLKEALESLPGKPAATQAPVRPQNASEAIWTYSRKLIAEWTSAILVTLAGPLCLLLMQIAARREAESLKPDNHGEDA